MRRDRQTDRQTDYTKKKKVSKKMPTERNEEEIATSLGRGWRGRGGGERRDGVRGRREEKNSNTSELW